MATANAHSTSVQAGIVFNDGTQQLEGGLWQNAAEKQGRSLGNAVAAVAVLQTVTGDTNRGRQTA